MHQRDFSVCYRDWPEGRNSHRWADDQISFSTQTDRTSQRERGFDARTQAPFYANLLNHYKCEMPALRRNCWLSITVVIYVLFYCIISGRRSNRLKFYLSLLLLLLYSLSWECCCCCHPLSSRFLTSSSSQDMDRICEGPLLLPSVPLSLVLSGETRSTILYTTRVGGGSTQNLKRVNRYALFSQ
jgi:hypothetical protein